MIILNVSFELCGDYDYHNDHDGNQVNSDDHKSCDKGSSVRPYDRHCCLCRKTNKVPFQKELAFAIIMYI